MITDIEFQNRRDVMRVAPWLDMPLLRTQLKAILQAQLDDKRRGFMNGYVKAYQEDMQSFCNGERDRIPRCTSVVQFIRNKMAEIFPSTAIDAALGEATALICTHIMQVRVWRVTDRGAGMEETPGETPYRISPALEDEDDGENYEYDEEEEY